MKWPVRQADREDWKNIQEFFKNLDAISRYYYYGYYATDESIDLLWTKFDQEDNHVFFVVESGADSIGVAQLSTIEGHAEIGVAVNPRYRRHGIAQTLVDRSVLWCKTHEVSDLMMYCLPENNVIQKLIRKNNLLPLMMSQPAEARFAVPTAKPEELQKESVAEYASAWSTLYRRLWSRWAPTTSLGR